MPAPEPPDPHALIALAAQHRSAGRLRDAVLACDAAIRAAPDYAEAWLERGFVFASGGSMARAEECYERVLALDPSNPDAHAGLASIAARDGRGAQARGHAEAALALEPANPTAALALATVELDEGAPKAARAVLEALLAGLTEPAGDRSAALTLLGDARAKLGDAAGAHAAYLRAKADFAAIHASRYAEREPHRAFVERIAQGISTLDFAPSHPTDEPPHAAAKHLFLLGYPRSGNTLAENVLASLPGVVAIEERPTLRVADQAYLAAPEGLAALARASGAELQAMRASYWQKVAEAGIAAAGRTLVDMDPLKGTRLPLIARLFPHARVVLMLRDPRDVVWSCFRTNFALSNAALDFTTIEGAAAHYDAMMRLIATARARLPLTVHELRYEDLIADFDAATRALCAFAGVPWDPAMRRFDKTAKARGVATASAGQVRKGLYDGSGQWRPFARWLEPAMPLLAPWVERFGYD